MCPRLRTPLLLAGFSLVSDAALGVCVAGLTVLLHLWGHWLVLVTLMLIGYFVAPWLSGSVACEISYAL